MFRTVTWFIYLCLISFQSLASSELADFEKKQIQLLRETNHQEIYQDCQKLMRSSIGKGITGKTYFDGDPNYLSNLPESIRLLEPTYVHISEVLVSVNFVSQANTQYVEYYSNEFASPGPRYGTSKGWGWRSDPVSVEDLTGDESPEYLNKEFEHFELELTPGILYFRFKNEKPLAPEGINIDTIKKDYQETYILMYNTMDQWMKELDAHRYQLMHKTDHEQLLQACRELIKKCNEGIIDDGISFNDESFFDDEHTQEYIERSKEQRKLIPQIILDLKPMSLSFYSKDVDSYGFDSGDHKEYVKIIFIGGIHHAGVYAYLEDETEVDPDSMMLRRGLFYYDDNLRGSGQEYKQYLQSLKQETQTFSEWVRKNMQQNDPNNISP